MLMSAPAAFLPLSPPARNSTQVGQDDDLGALALQFCKEHSIDVGEAANIAMELYNARQGAEEAEAGKAYEAVDGGDGDRTPDRSDAGTDVLEFEVALDINDTEYTLVVSVEY